MGEAGEGMYGALTNAELTTLQDILYTATEKAFQLRDRSLHEEVAELFMEAGHALLGRLVGYEAAASSAAI
jgi:hypothetical protein